MIDKSGAADVLVKVVHVCACRCSSPWQLLVFIQYYTHSSSVYTVQKSLTSGNNSGWQPSFFIDCNNYECICNVFHKTCAYTDRVLK